ncbi:MAG: GNAT family N-acetyltransferase, partial [Xanthobacteraceae bacterium]
MPRAGSVQLAAYDEANLDARTRSVSIANAVPPPIEFAIYESLADAEGDWRAFERQADCSVFQTFDWLSTWQRHIGVRGGVRPAIVVGRAGGEVLLILPLATQKIAFARELVWLGSDLCDYNAPLLAPQFSLKLGSRPFREVWQHIVAALQSRPWLSYDLVRLEKMPANVGTQANPMLALGVMTNPSGAYCTPLTAPWEAFYTAKRSAATRRRDRTKRRRLAETGALTLLHPDDDKEILAALDTLMAQKSCALLQMGADNLFARPGYREFYRALATDPRSKPLVHVSQLN